MGFLLKPLKGSNDHIPYVEKQKDTFLYQEARRKLGRSLRGKKNPHKVNKGEDKSIIPIKTGRGRQILKGCKERSDYNKKGMGQSYQRLCRSKKRKTDYRGVSRPLKQGQKDNGEW